MNYPNKKEHSNKVCIEYGNRGMTLESDINSSNKYYLDNDIALIYKKPTPIKVVKVNYIKNKITEGYYEVPSTTDYNGIYKGKYIDFEAKETKSKTSNF
jgi:recombination protein U